VILGAGIAGLSTATFLKEHGIQALVLEKGSTYGGLGRSFRWNHLSGTNDGARYI
jgi:protoporphyrinogen oxidase